MIEPGRLKWWGLRGVGVAGLVALLLLPALATNFEGGMNALRKGYFKEAISDFSAAMQRGDTDSAVYLGLLAWHGMGTAQDRTGAAKYFAFAAEQGEPLAQYYLGLIYKDAFGLGHLQSAARSGYAPAQVDLGLRFHAGQGVEVNLEAAAFWYTKAAEQGEPRAFDRLAVMHYYGQFFEKNDRIAAYNSMIATRLYRSAKFRETQAKYIAAFTKSMSAQDIALIEYSAGEQANELLRLHRQEIGQMIFERAYLTSDFAYLATKQPDLAGEPRPTNLLNFLERGMAYYLTGRCEDARNAFEKADERGEGQGRPRALLNKMDGCVTPATPKLA